MALMKKTHRERAALAVFAALVVFAGAAFATYIVAGHSWNIAASNIDDAVGSMEGYAVIVYPGELEEIVASKPSSGEEGEKAEEKSAEADGQEPQSEAGSSDAASAMDDARESDAEGEGASAAEGDFAVEGEEGEKADPLSALHQAEPIDMAELEQAYRDKDATVLALDLDRPWRYGEGMVLNRGGVRFGVLYAEWVTSSIVVQRQVDELIAQSVDYVVVVAKGKRVVSNLSGVDICIALQDEGIMPSGAVSDGVFRAQVPKKGRAGAILISPSGVVSAKTVTEL